MQTRQAKKSWPNQVNVYYRVSSKGVYAFLLTTSQLPVGLGLKFWTFFNSPVYADNETDLNSIPRGFLGRDI